MDTVEADRHRAALPPINFLDIEKIKRAEAAEYQRKHSAPAMASPSFPTSRPTDAYGHPPPLSAAPTSAALSGLISPPDSRRTSGDEDERSHPARQSLPSIHEALGGDQPLPYPTTAPVPTTAPSQYRPPHADTSPSDGPPRSFADGSHPGPSAAYGHPPPRSPYLNHQPTSAPSAPPPPNSQPSESLPRSGMANAHNPKLPTLHPLSTGQSPAEQSRPQPPYSLKPQPGSATSPAFEQGPQSASAMNAPPFGYTSYPSQYPYSAPPPTAPGAFTPHQAYTPPRYSQQWRSDATDTSRAEESKRSGRVGGTTYGESVKRHLETFDVEASLDDINNGAGRMIAFSQHYSQRSHQTQRSGPVPGSLPTLAELDDNIQVARRVQESFIRIREVVLTQQTAMAEQAHDHRLKAAHGYEPEEPQQPPPSQPPHAFPDDQKPGGFAGNDPKKRRARAAPPGRCHSCKRSETPEWRRGPDGARTLCNACGLHYAKLTRKMGNNKTAIGSSNLRPKNMSNGDAPA